MANHIHVHFGGKPGGGKTAARDAASKADFKKQLEKEKTLVGLEAIGEKIIKAGLNDQEMKSFYIAQRARVMKSKSGPKLGPHEGEE